MKNLPKGIQALIGAGLIAILVLVVRQQRHSADDAGWDALAVAARAGNSVEALRTAVQDSKDTSAEPWANVQLATRLYDEGGPANLEQARVVAQQALERFQDHPAAAYLSRILAAVASLQPVTTG